MVSAAIHPPPCEFSQLLTKRYKDPLFLLPPTPSDYLALRKPVYPKNFSLNSNQQLDLPTMRFATTLRAALSKAKAFIKVNETPKPTTQKLKKAFKRVTTFKASGKTSRTAPTTPTTTVVAGSEAGLTHSVSTLECLVDLAFEVNERFGDRDTFTPAGYDSVVIEVRSVSSSPATSIKDFDMEEDEETLVDSDEEDEDELIDVIEEEDDKEAHAERVAHRQALSEPFDDFVIKSAALRVALFARSDARDESVMKLSNYANRFPRTVGPTRRSILGQLGQSSGLRNSWSAEEDPSVKAAAPVTSVSAKELSSNAEAELCPPFSFIEGW